MKAKGSIAKARYLRRQMTAAERMLWAQLRRNRMNGMHFRRQVPFAPYVLDFACVTHRLVIEVDGGQHAARAASDAERTKLLEHHGWKVIHFWNHDVLQNINGVMQVIYAQLPPPYPSPAKAGEGTGGETSQPHQH